MNVINIKYYYYMNYIEQIIQIINILKIEKMKLHKYSWIKLIGKFKYIYISNTIYRFIIKCRM